MQGEISMENEVNKIVKWLQEQVKQAQVDGLLVGVSGGLDSAVVANLIKRACPDNSLGVMMPIYTSDSNLYDARDVIEQASIDSLIVDLTDTHHVMYEQMVMIIKLYLIYTDNYNYLVVGTDNAAEWYTGYFTKYGDGGVDILPIVDFTKTEVREIAAFLGVPEQVVTKKPSADLWENQTDEKEMGVAYDVIDAYLKGEEISAEDKATIERMHERSEHKRTSLPKYNRN